MHLNQDFLGSVNRIRASLSEWDERTSELMESWRDQTGAEYREQHLVPVGVTLRRLIIALQEAADTAQSINQACREQDFL